MFLDELKIEIRFYRPRKRCSMVIGELSRKILGSEFFREGGFCEDVPLCFPFQGVFIMTYSGFELTTYDSTR